MLICVSQETTHVEIVGDWALSANVLPVESASALYTNFVKGTCNVITEEQTGISATVLELKGFTGNDYVVRYFAVFEGTLGCRDSRGRCVLERHCVLGRGVSFQCRRMWH